MNFVNEPDGNLSETDDVIAEEAQAESGDVLSNTVYNTLKSQLMHGAAAAFAAAEGS